MWNDSTLVARLLLCRLELSAGSPFLHNAFSFLDGSAGVVHGRMHSNKKTQGQHRGAFASQSMGQHGATNMRERDNDMVSTGFTVEVLGLGVLTS